MSAAICSLFGHKKTTLLDENKVLKLYCTRCCRWQRDWGKSSSTVDGFIRGLGGFVVAFIATFAPLMVAGQGVSFAFWTAIAPASAALGWGTVLGKRDESNKAGPSRG